MYDDDRGPFVDAGVVLHAQCRADLDAAQDEIERSIADREEQRELIDAQQPVIDAAITYASVLVSDQSPSAKLDAHAALLRAAAGDRSRWCLMTTKIADAVSVAALLTLCALAGAALWVAGTIEDINDWIGGDS